LDITDAAEDAAYAAQVSTMGGLPKQRAQNAYYAEQEYSSKPQCRKTFSLHEINKRGDAAHKCHKQPVIYIPFSKPTIPK